LQAVALGSEPLTGTAPTGSYNRPFIATGDRMALNATTYKAELTISDMDRHYYATHALTLARHPSETDERLMVRLLAFALHADERLQFGKGISSDEEPDLWRKDLTGEILEWIELGNPDEQRIRKACGRARHVVVLNFSGRGADIWWDKNQALLARAKNLTVIDIAAPAVAALAAMAKRNMRLQCLIQDRQVQLLGETSSVTIEPTVRMAPSQTVR
jgi:uncharacterized protein YaeQ